jgi:segregation and condensation protein A
MSESATKIDQTQQIPSTVDEDLTPAKKPDTAAQNPDFEEDAEPVYKTDVKTGEQLVLDLDGYDGPIDMLLGLARDQKVDLTQISILALANQYLDFIETAKDLRIELAADYLVMAAWLAYLKSRLLVPQEEVIDDEPTGAEMAEALAFQLRRLESMRNAADMLFERPQLGIDMFVRGAPERMRVNSTSIFEVDLYEILSAYGDIQRRQEYSTYKVEPFQLMSVEQALERIEAMLGRIPGDWMDISQFLPGMKGKDSVVKRSAIASTFGASLEMAKRGMIEIRQEGNYAPIYIRKKRSES